MFNSNEVFWNYNNTIHKWITNYPWYTITCCKEPYQFISDKSHQISYVLVWSYNKYFVHRFNYIRRE